MTSETWFNGDLTISQPREGYRYTIDPLILCAQIFARKDSHILDLGCGCGIMPLILGYRHPEARITGVDIQERLTEIATRNLTANQMQDRTRILHRDINGLTLKDIKTPADIIISNPPYKRKGTGRINPHREKALARHEILVTIDQVFAAAAILLSPDGRLNIIFPADRLKDLESAAMASGFFMEWIRNVHLFKDDSPFRVLISAAKKPPESRRMKPALVLYHNDRTPTKAHMALFNP